MKATFILALIFLSLVSCNKDKNNKQDKQKTTKKVKSTPNFDFEKDGSLIVLDNKTIKKAINKFPTLVVLFYSPVCPYSNKLLPEFAKAAEMLSNYKITLAKADAATDKDLANEYQVQAFPMVLGIGGKTREIYNGKRKAANIVSWVLKKFVSPIQVLKTESELEKFITDNEVALVYFGKDDKTIQIIKNASKKIDSFPFASINDEKVFSKYDTKENMLILFKKTDEKKRQFTEINEGKIVDFVYKYAYPKVMNFEDEVSELIFDKRQPALVYFDNKNSTKFKSYSDILTKAAEKLDYKIKVVIADTTKAYPQKLADYIGVRKTQIPAFRILSLLKGEEKVKVFSPETKEVNIDNLVKFVNDWEDKKLTPDIKSQIEPKNEKGPVVTLVGKNFKEKVFQNKKDVMVVFHAPWCGHCKELSVTYEKLAKRLKEGNSELILAQIDATENDVDDVKLDGYPTILFYPGDKKDKAPIEFTGERNEEEMIKFIQKHASNALNISEKKKNKPHVKKKEETKKEEKKKEEDDSTISDL